MKKEDIIRMAQEVQFEGFGNGDWVCTTEEIERFAALVAAAEREACAKLCDDGYDTFFANNGVEHNRKRYDQQAVERAMRASVEFVTADCAAAIRARAIK